MIKPAFAQEITILPRHRRSEGSRGRSCFYIAQLWMTVVIVGGLAVMLFMIWGGLQWLMAGGDKAKLEEAHHKITNSLIGLGVLVGSFAVIYFIGGVLKIDLLKPVFPVNY